MLARKKSGFTLLDLLTVIAIIAIMATIVLASLSRSRNDSKDANIRANMNSLRTSADLYYTNGTTYTGMCSDDSIAKIKTTVLDLIGNSVTCVENGNTYTAYVLLKGGQYFCVDATGNAGTIGTTAPVDGTNNFASGVKCK